MERMEEAFHSWMTLIAKEPWHSKIYADYLEESGTDPEQILFWRTATEEAVSQRAKVILVMDTLNKATVKLGDAICRISVSFTRAFQGLASFFQETSQIVGTGSRKTQRRRWARHCRRSRSTRRLND